MKRYADKKRKAQPSKLVAGDMVLMKQKKHTKFSSKFDPVPVRLKGTMVTVVRNGKYVTWSSPQSAGRERPVAFYS